MQCFLFYIICSLFAQYCSGASLIKMWFSLYNIWFVLESSLYSKWIALLFGEMRKTLLSLWNAVSCISFTSNENLMLFFLRCAVQGRASTFLNLPHQLSLHPCSPSLFILTNLLLFLHTLLCCFLPLHLLLQSLHCQFVALASPSVIDHGGNSVGFASLEMCVSVGKERRSNTLITAGL